MFNYKDNLNILRNATRFEGYSSDAFYYLYTTKNKNTKVYIGYIIFNSRLKVSNYIELSQMQENIIKMIKHYEGGDLNKNICFITLLELKINSPLVPDSSLFEKGHQFKKHMEGKYNISLGGVVTIAPNDKTYKRYTDSVKALLKDADMYISSSKTEAKKYLKVLIEKRG